MAVEAAPKRTSLPSMLTAVETPACACGRDGLGFSGVDARRAEQEDDQGGGGHQGATLPV